MEEVLLICRVCLTPDEEENFISLFDKKGNYATKINSLCKDQGLVSYLFKASV